MKKRFTHFQIPRWGLIESFWLATLSAALIQLFLTHFTASHPHGLIVRGDLPDLGDGNIPGSFVKLVSLEFSQVRQRSGQESAPPPEPPPASIAEPKIELQEWALTLPAAGHRLFMTTHGEIREKPEPPDLKEIRAAAAPRPRGSTVVSPNRAAEARIDPRIISGISTEPRTGN